MMWTLALVLLLLWAVGLVTAHVFGGFIHILVIAAVIVLAVNLIRGRRQPA